MPKNSENAATGARPEERLEEIVLAYLKAVDAGQVVDPREVVARHPELAAELAEFFAGEAWLKPRVEPLRGAAPAVDAANTGMEATGSFPDRPHNHPSATPAREAGEHTSAGARFHILRPHAQGGLGLVSVALDTELHREVAFKEIQERYAHDAGSRARFVLEAEITGGLEHPGIVPIYGLGTHADGRPFYAMRFIKGDSLKEAIGAFHKRRSADRAESPEKNAEEPVFSVPSSDDFSSLEFHKLLRRFVDVCNAIAYAHSRGVLHRDIKPGNIMLGKYGETLVVDWGLAKAGITASRAASAAGSAVPSESLLRPSSAHDSAETLAGTALGTPAYMSPEQAAGRIGELGPQSDVYALGATLYHVLTGLIPFQGEVAEILKNVKAGIFPSPRQVQPAVPPALEAVCLKAMALRQADRYGSTRELAEEIERWLADEPVRAWPEAWTVKARRWTGRHRVLVSAAVACLVVAVGALAIGTALLSDANEIIRNREADTRAANQQLKKANEETTIAYQAEKTALDHTEDLLATSRMMLARSRFEDGQASLAKDLLEQVPGRFRLTPWGFLKQYTQGSLFTLYGHTQSVTSVAFAADGQVMASASWDKTIKLWDARSGQLLRTLRGHAGPVKSVAFAADGRVLASASDDQTVKLWNTWTGQELRILHGHNGTVTSVAFAADDQVLASASHDKTVKLWNARTGQELRTLPGHTNHVTSVAFTGDGQVLASASADHRVKLWDARTGQELRTLVGFASVALTTDGQVLASAYGDHTVRLWDMRTGQQLHNLRGHTDQVMSVAFSADGQMLASASLDQTVKLWDTRTGQELRTVRGHTSLLTSVAFAADGQVLATASHDTTVKLWHARTGQELRTLRGHKHYVTSAAFSADGQILASASWDKTVKLWDMRTGQELRTLRGYTTVKSVAFAADGQVLASASSENHTVKLWDVRTGKVLRTLWGHRGNVNSLAFAAHGHMLASASADHTVKLWDVRTGQELHTLHGHTGGKVAFAGDGRVLASWSNKTVKLWDAPTGQELRTLPITTPIVAFAADGQVLATSATEDNTVKLWNARTGQNLLTLRGHTGGVTSAAFTADGQVLASASLDQTVKLWDTRTGQELRTLRGHTRWVTSVAFSADGQALASTSEDNTVKVWDARTSQELVRLREPTSPITSVVIPASLDKERRFRLWVTAPDIHLHRELAEQAEKDKQPLAMAFRIGRYLAAQYATGPQQPAKWAGTVGLAPHLPGLLAVLPLQVKNSIHGSAFPDGIACAGILCKDSHILPARLRIGTTRALEGDPTSWINYAFHGGALIRNGEYARALDVLTHAARLRGKASPLTHAFLALASLELGQHVKAKEYLAQAERAKVASWEEAALYRLLKPEVDVALTAKLPPGGFPFLKSPPRRSLSPGTAGVWRGKEPANTACNNE